MNKNTELRAWVLSHKCKGWSYQKNKRGYFDGFICKKLDDPLIHTKFDSYKSLKNLCKPCPKIQKDKIYLKYLKRGN